MRSGPCVVGNGYRLALPIDLKEQGAQRIGQLVLVPPEPLLVPAEEKGKDKQKAANGDNGEGAGPNAR